jgi:hypothetical protein
MDIETDRSCSSKANDMEAEDTYLRLHEVSRGILADALEAITELRGRMICF